MSSTDLFAAKNNFFPRPNSTRGLWVFLLLPFSIILTAFKNPVVLTSTYKLNSTVSIFLLWVYAYILAAVVKNREIKIFDFWNIVGAKFLACLLYFFWEKSLVFSMLSGNFIIYSQLIIFGFLLRKLPESFSLGEAGLISQAFTLFLYSITLNIYSFFSLNILRSNLHIATLIIQIGLLGILFLSYLLYKFRIKRPIPFYAITLLVGIFLILLPLHFILAQSAVLWIFLQVIEDPTLMKIFIYWSACAGVAALAVSNQVYYAKKASTGTRKIFHILAILVFLPGLYFRCCFLYLSTGVVLGIFIFLEILRLLSIPPWGIKLQEGYEVFKDEQQDTGLLALTPIYLLIGVSLPIWIHPSPCDVTDSAQFTIVPLLSGLSAIGIGDSAASFIGSRYGKHKWNGSLKSIQGTFGCFFSQLGFYYTMYQFGLLPYLSADEVLRIIIAVFINSAVEAKTSQIDNLILPLISYIILI